MIIIVEGIDRVGKTTLCKMLNEEIGYPILDDRSIFDKNKEISMIVEAERMSAQISLLKYVDNIIIDRFHISEYVYGLVEREYENTFMFRIDKKLAKLNAVLILVNPVDINKSSEEHGKSLLRHQQAFKLFYCISGMKKFECNYFAFDNVVKAIKSAIKEGN